MKLYLRTKSVLDERETLEGEYFEIARRLREMKG